jgi:deoxyadenosine/deoxycytidine kinase
MHIAVTGNIGAGKTTLASKLAKHFGWEVLYEAVEGNPYLSDFYGDMERWAFHLQIYFLKSRYEQVMQIQQSNKRIIQDRTIYEDAYIFALNLYQSGVMSENDYNTYKGIFDLMMETVKAPDLTIYLKAGMPKLISQIKKRGRDFESNISEDYLLALNKHYEDFTKNYKAGKLLVLDVNDLDYLNNPEDLAFVIQSVDKALLYETPQVAEPLTQPSLFDNKA